MQNLSSSRFFRNLVWLFLGLSSNFVNAAETVSTKETVTNKALVLVQNAWVRSTNAGQSVGAAYMTLTSPQDSQLVAIESDVSKSVEIHSMSMQDGVMKMRMLDALPLAAGKPYSLAPGGFHLMLFDLKKPLNVGDTVNFVLHFKKTDAKSNKEIDLNQKVKVLVQASADAVDGKSTANDDHGSHEHHH